MIIISDSKKNAIRFIPRSSKFIKVNKIIKFDMLKEFNFQSIVNVISVNFITRAFALFKFIAKTKNNAIKLFTVKNSQLTLVQNAVAQSAISLKNIVLATLKIRVIPIAVQLNLNADRLSKAVLRLMSSIVPCGISLNSTTTDRFILQAKSNIRLKLEAYLSLFTRIFARILENKINFLNTVDTRLRLFCKTKNDCSISLTNITAPTLKLFSTTFISKLNIKASAAAIVYRPRTLDELYSNKLEDWYDKTLEEIFYGETIE